MFMRLGSVGIAMSALMLSVMPVNADPSSCKTSAITVVERETVDVLQNMYSVQLELEIADRKLNELNRQKNVGYNSNDATSVNHYNNLIDKYNGVVRERSKLVNEYNQLKDSFNALVDKISPSRNITFITCLNGELTVVESTTTRQNAELLNIDIETLRQNIETLRH